MKIRIIIILYIIFCMIVAYAGNITSRKMTRNNQMQSKPAMPISTQRKFAIYTEIDPLRTEALKKVKTRT